MCPYTPIRFPAEARLCAEADRLHGYTSVVELPPTLDIQLMPMPVASCAVAAHQHMQESLFSGYASHQTSVAAVIISRLIGRCLVMLTVSLCLTGCGVGGAKRRWQVIHCQAGGTVLPAVCGGCSDRWSRCGCV